MLSHKKLLHVSIDVFLVPPNAAWIHPTFVWSPVYWRAHSLSGFSILLTLLSLHFSRTIGDCPSCLSFCAKHSASDVPCGVHTALPRGFNSPCVMVHCFIYSYSPLFVFTVSCSFNWLLTMLINAATNILVFILICVWRCFSEFVLLIWHL